jgi:hypothetical protein
MAAFIAWTLFALTALAFLGLIFSAGSLIGRSACRLFSRS